MIVEDPEALKSWLAVLLSKKCDADPEALAKYILALVKKDKSTQALKTFLLDQLEIFLSKETKSFVDLLFDALQTKSYLAPLSNATASVDLSMSSLPTKTICDVTNPPKDESLQPGSSVRIESSNDSKDKSYRNRDGSGPRKRSVDDEHNSNKKSRPSFKSHSDDYYSSKPSTRGKNQENKNDGNYSSFHNDYYSSKTIKREKSQERKNDGNYKSRRSRSKSADRDRSRSRSRSKSREREKRSYSTAESSSHDKPDSRNSKSDHPKTIPSSILPHGDSDYRLRPNTDSLKIQNKGLAHLTKQTKRCQDYDEKGYCLKGDFCDFDHGTDPILVDNVSALNFGVALPPDQFEGECLKPPLPPTPPSIPPPPLPSVPPPLPSGPPPPLPPPHAGSFVPEPYNPEVPGMNMFPLNANFFMPPPVLPHVLQPPPPLPPTSGPPPFHNKREHRTRELIGVATVDSYDSPNTYQSLDRRRDKEVNNDRPYPKSLNSGYTTVRSEASNQRGDFKSKGFDYSRLGPLPQAHSSRKCLEIRKIPKALNNITNLHNHFCKFGNVVNIEIGCDNDPEAAKVSFATHIEATRAYRSTEPILNNRFIKVFWNNNGFEKGADSTSARDVLETEAPPPITEDIPGISKEPKEEAVIGMDTSIEISLPSKGPRTVVVSNPHKTKSVFTHSAMFTRKGPQREAINPVHRKKMFELHQAKTEFLKAQLEYQKRILDQLIKAKNQKEKDFLKKTLLTISEKIKELQSDLKKDSEDLKNLLKNAPESRMNLKTAAKKELLDAELDLYNKEHNGDEDTSELVLKVNEMKRKAKALGVLESSPHIPKYPFRRRGTSRYHPTTSSSSLSIDRRPRKLLVLGSSDKEGLQRHFKQFGNIETLVEVSGGILVTFCSRMEAEAACTYGAKYEDKILNLSWFNEHQKSNVQNPEFNNEASDQTTIEAELGDVDDEEEEDEEDSEARSWRR